MKARSVVLAVALAAVVGSFGVVTNADGDEGKKVTVQGEILDMACFVAHGAKGDEHADCARNCVKGGQPMGLLASDGTVYLLYASHKDGAAFEEAKDLAGKQVEIKGVEAAASGIKGIEVNAVKSL